MSCWIACVSSISTIFAHLLTFWPRLPLLFSHEMMAARHSCVEHLVINLSSYANCSWWKAMWTILYQELKQLGPLVDCNFFTYLPIGHCTQSIHQSYKGPFESEKNCFQFLGSSWALDSSVCNIIICLHLFFFYAGPNFICVFLLLI